MKQVIDWVLAPAVFVSLPGRSQATWKPRMLAATAVLWATSELSTLHERFAQARTIIKKVFRWQPAPGMSYQGCLKRLGKWQPELRGAGVPHLREQRQAELPAQGETAGSAVVAGDGSRVALARSASVAATLAPPRRRTRSAPRQQASGARRAPKTQAAAAGRRKPPPPSCGGRW